MKTIKQIDEKIEWFAEDLSEIEKSTLPTFRKLFKAAIGMGVSKNPEEAVDLYQIGLKLKIDGPDISLEDAEFKRLKECCNPNPANWISHVHACVLMKIKEAEKE